MLQYISAVRWKKQHFLDITTHLLKWLIQLFQKVQQSFEYEILTPFRYMTTELNSWKVIKYEILAPFKWLEVFTHYHPIYSRTQWWKWNNLNNILLNKYLKNKETVESDYSSNFIFTGQEENISYSFNKNPKVPCLEVET